MLYFLGILKWMLTGPAMLTCVSTQDAFLPSTQYQPLAISPSNPPLVWIPPLLDINIVEHYVWLICSWLELLHICAWCDMHGHLLIHYGYPFTSSLPSNTSFHMHWLWCSPSQCSPFTLSYPYLCCPAILSSRPHPSLPILKGLAHFHNTHLVSLEYHSLTTYTHKIFHHQYEAYCTRCIQIFCLILLCTSCQFLFYPSNDGHLLPS